jgi:lipoprotein signal peptidase
MNTILIYNHSSMVSASQVALGSNFRNDASHHYFVGNYGVALILLATHQYFRSLSEVMVSALLFSLRLLTYVFDLNQCLSLYRWELAT